jgi:uncharacterized membrane protein
MPNELQKDNSIEENKGFETASIPDKSEPIPSYPDTRGIFIATKSSYVFSGPIPPPEILKGYNEVVKDGAERIIVMAEKQSDHRMQLENHAVRESGRGQIFAFILALVGMGITLISLKWGFEVVAGIFGSTTIVGLVSVFVLGKKAQQKDLSGKNS